MNISPHFLFQRSSSITVTETGSEVFLPDAPSGSCLGMRSSGALKNLPLYGMFLLTLMIAPTIQAQTNLSTSPIPAAEYNPINTDDGFADEEGAALIPQSANRATHNSSKPTKEVLRTENVSMSLGSRLQIRYSYLDPETGDANGSFAVRRARFSMGGDAYEHFRYVVQLELAGGSANIIDANIRYDLVPMASLIAGQRKAYFGRQQLNSSGNLSFVDRSIVSGSFAPGRQNGLSLVGHHESGRFEYNFGLYNGTGINTGNDNNRYLKTARFVFTPFGVYSPVESAHDYPDSPKIAIGVSAMHTTTGADDDKTSILRFNAEGAFKLGGFSATGEFYREEADPAAADRFRTNGWYTQAGYLLPNRKNEITVRYATISPDLPVNHDVTETGVAVSHYFQQHRAKIQADLRNILRKEPGTRDLEFRVQIQLAF